jgi:hypothetical protein
MFISMHQMNLIVNTPSIGYVIPDAISPRADSKFGCRFRSFSGAGTPSDPLSLTIEG